MIFFSIILPVYNADKYLSNCLESVISQEFNDYELLVINDGSTDSSDQICKKFANGQNRIKYFTKVNEGVSIARNVGLDHAQGKYIMFIDADDIIFPSALRILHDYLEKEKLDYLRFEFQTIDEYGRKLYPNYEARKRRKHDRCVVNAVDCIQHIIRNEFFLWSGVFKRSIITDYYLRFFPGCTYNEDTLFMMQFFTHSVSHSYLKCILYGYRKIPTAATATFSERNYNDVRSVALSLISLSSHRPLELNKQFKSTIENLCYRLFLEKGDFFVKSETALLDYCLSHPCMIEWKFFKILGANKMFFKTIHPILIFFRKVNKRFYI